MTWGKPEAAEETEPLPDTIEELDELALTIREEIAGIESQFAQRKAEIEERAQASGRLDKWGKPLNDPAEWTEYARWRGSAAAAKRYKEIELSSVKGAIREKRARLGLTGRPELVTVDVSSDPLGALYVTAKKLAGRIGWAKLDAEDTAVLDAVRHLLLHTK